MRAPSGHSITCGYYPLVIEVLFCQGLLQALLSHLLSLKQLTGEIMGYFLNGFDLKQE